MERLSLVKFHKYPRRILLSRRIIARIPTETTRYIHRSAGFTTLMSDLGLEGIGNYVSIMNERVSILRGMSRTGNIDPRSILSLVETVNSATETNNANLNLIRNSVVRFMHTGAEPVIRPRIYERQEDPTADHAAESRLRDSPPVPVSGNNPNSAAAGCDAYDR
jgi:hypothetical protein